MNVYHLDVHIDFCYTYESSRYDLVQFGPLDMISQQMLSRVSAILQDAQTLVRGFLSGCQVIRGPFARVERYPGKTNARVESYQGEILSPRASFLDV